MKKLTKWIGLVLAGILLLAMAGCGNDKTADAEETVIKVGVCGENNEQWEPITESLAKEGIKLELVKFSDYSLPNQALADGEIDMNAFQHYTFLNTEIENKGFDLTPIGETLITVLGLYSDKIKSVDELKEGDKIALPNDTTNLGRGLNVIASTGLIKLNPEAGYKPEVSDIIENPLNLEFVEVDSSQTVSLLPDVAAAIINSNFVLDAGMSPQEDAIYTKPIDEFDKPYVNILVVRTEDKDNELYKKVVEAYHTDEVKAAIDKMYQGTTVTVW